jgi:DNA-binding transcriptional MerR regulator
MTIAELAEQVGMTARNIRAYQSKGLLPPPEIKGRVAYYYGGHAARLELIASLQREGFTLAGIKRLIEQPESYSAIVADRRRRVRSGDADDADLAPWVPIPEDKLRAIRSDLPELLAAHGLVWWVSGRLVTSTVLAGIGRSLVDHGLPLDVIIDLQLLAGDTAARIGGMIRALLAGNSAPELSRGTHADASRVAVQLFAAGFEISLAHAAAQNNRHASG